MSGAGKDQSRATMVDVAKAAGVSLKTVSRVLNNEEYVSEKTREKVLSATDSLNYQLNQAARTLRAGSARIVALLLDNPSRSYLDNVHLGALNRCHEHGLQLLLDECKNLEDVKQVVDAVMPVGVILTPPLSDNAQVIAYLKRSGINYVLIAPGKIEPQTLSVVIDDRAAARQITNFLIGKGHKRIGFIKGHPDHTAAHRRYDGFQDALSAAGIPLDESLIQQGYFDYASGLTCGENLLLLDDPPTAIFSSNDEMAAGIISAAYANKINVPDDLSIVGFDDVQIAAIISPNLTTVRQPIAELASEAVDMIAKLDWGQRITSFNKTLIHEIVERASVRQLD